mgnify:CR=1 FL=1
MKIFVTGGAGFIGGNFVLKQVLQEGNEVLNNTIDELYGRVRGLKGVNPVDKYSIIDMSTQEKSQILMWSCSICKGAHMSKDCPNRNTFGANIGGETIRIIISDVGGRLGRYAGVGR